jgi:tetratricopeptide (TPR) repeat protein
LSEDVERTLRDLLISEGSSEKVARNLIERMKKESPARKERWAFAHFLIHAGFYKDLLGLYADWFREKNRIPLMAFCHLLNLSGFRPKAEFLKQLFVAIDETEEPQFVFSPWVEIDPRFEVLHQKAFESVMHNAEVHRQKLSAKLEYFRVNRMIDEEARLLDEMLEIYPHDQILKNEKENFKIRWADTLIARKALEAFDESFIYAKSNAKPADVEIARVIATSFQEAASKNPRAAYNLALGLYFLELYESALSVLALAPQTPAVDWFHIECLIQSRRFVECLDAISNIETVYSNDPETIFGATYFRAQALNGLGQIGVATELLRSIVAIRPSYRAAHSLLLKWAGRGLA